MIWLDRLRVLLCLRTGPIFVLVEASLDVNVKGDGNVGSGAQNKECWMDSAAGSTLGAETTWNATPLSFSSFAGIAALLAALVCVFRRLGNRDKPLVVGTGNRCKEAGDMVPDLSE